MALSNFIPQVWSARLLENLEKNHVFAGVANRHDEGDIRGCGEQVKINSIGPISIGTYTKNTNIEEPETLTDAQMVLNIDQAKYFNFQIDDIDRAQQSPKVMDAAMRAAAYALADEADRYIAGLHAQAAEKNCIGTSAAPVELSDATEAYQYLVQLAVKLDEANVPQVGRWVVVPAWFHAALLMDPRFVQAGTASSDRILRVGEVGEAAGFTILTSNNVAEDAGAFKIMCGAERTIAYAEQITEVSAYRPEKRFADALKGLHLYGAKVVDASALAVLSVKRPDSF